MSCEAHALAASRGMLAQEDVDLIRELVEVGLERVGDAPVMLNVYDLGAGSGTKALSVFAAAKPGDVRVTTVDWDRDELGWASLAISNIGRKSDWRGLLTDAVVAVSQIDILLVGVEHTYEGTRGIVETWLPKMKDGGFIWIHDYDGGVKRAVDDLVGEGKLAKLATRGLGWAGAKPSTSEVTDVSPEQFEGDGPSDTEEAEEEENHGLPPLPASAFEPSSEDAASGVDEATAEPEPEPESSSGHDCECGWDVPEGKDYEKSLRTHKRTAKVHKS